MIALHKQQMSHLPEKLAFSLVNNRKRQVKTPRFTAREALGILLLTDRHPRPVTPSHHREKLS